MNNFHRNYESSNLVWAVEEMPEVHKNAFIEEGDEVLVGYVEPTRYLCVYRLTPTHEELRLVNWEQVGLPESQTTDYETLFTWSEDEPLPPYPTLKNERRSINAT
tara:strand:- start:4394 stop:4708 length:315 start_codon:yes stop_codon:yes gene_type:complete